MTPLRRRSLLLGALAASLAACRPSAQPHWSGGWVGADAARGHRLRDLRPAPLAAPVLQRRAGVLIVGAGIAGLGAARALMQAGIDDVHVFDLENGAGGNSRGHAIDGIACPLGAHYLPVPGDAAGAVQAFLEELGLSRRVAGRWI